MRRVTSVGGIFLKSINPEKLKKWYSTHLGLQTDNYGTSFEWRQSENPDKLFLNLVIFGKLFHTECVVNPVYLTYISGNQLVMHKTCQ